MEQGEVLFRENLAVQPFAFDDGIKQLGRLFFIFYCLRCQGVDGFGKGNGCRQCILAISSQDIGDFFRQKLRLIQDRYEIVFFRFIDENSFFGDMGILFDFAGNTMKFRRRNEGGDEEYVGAGKGYGQAGNEEVRLF